MLGDHDGTLLRRLDGGLLQLVDLDGNELKTAGLSSNDRDIITSRRESSGGGGGSTLLLLLSVVAVGLGLALSLTAAFLLGDRMSATH